MKARFRPWLYLLGAVFLAAVILYAEQPGDLQRTPAMTPLFPELQTEQIATIEIEQLLSAITLTRSGDGWVVQIRESAMAKNARDPAVDVEFDTTPRKADAERINQMLELMQTMEVGSIASRNADNHNKLQVGAIGLHVRAFDGDGVKRAHLIVGKQGPDYFSTYIRKDGADAAYLVKESLSGRFPVQVKQWRDKTVWNVDPDQLTKISIDRMDGGFQLEKSAAGAFELIDPKKLTGLSLEKLQEWFGQWTKLEATDIAEGVSKKEAGLVRPKTSITITFTDGTTRILNLGNDSPQGSPYGQTADSDEIYILPVVLRNALQEDWAEWTEPAPRVSS
jgi:hypothetical protein